MKKIALVVDQFYQNNRIFDESDPIVNRDNCQQHYIELKKQLLQQDVDLSTLDINTIFESEIIIFVNMPSATNKVYKESKHLGKKIYVIINELELIHINNQKTKWCNVDKIFTYQDEYIDNEKIFKLNYSFVFPKNITENINFYNKKLALMIAGNKNIKNKNELYSKRREIVRWFENNHPCDFDLYGINWDMVTFRSDNFVGKILNKIIPLRKFFHNKYSSYKGTVIDKKHVMQDYKFCICYENAKEIHGWITEKIFDCFFAGVIPVYWGAPNIEKYIPKNCFIDMREYENYQELYEYLSSMTMNEYMIYIDNINHFFQSIDEKYEFSIDYYIDTIYKHIDNDINFTTLASR